MATDAVARPDHRPLLPVRGILPRVALAVLLMVLVLAWLVATLDWPELSEQVSRVAKPGPLLAFAALYTLAFVMRSFAWNALLRIPNAREMFWILQTSLFLNHVAPVKAGEAARLLLAARKGADIADAAASTVLARVIDLVCLLALATILFAATAPNVPNAIVVPAVLLGGIAAVLIAMRQVRSGRLAELMDRVKPVRMFREGLARVKALDVGVASAWTLGAWVLEGLAVYAVLRAAGCDVAVYGAVAATAFTVLFQTFHFTPGGIGVYEASMATALSAYGVPFEEALGFALVTHGVKFGYALTVGAAGAAYEGISLLRDRPTDDAASSRGHKHAGRFEVVMARLWNVANEGKPFTVVFSLGCFAIATALTVDGSTHVLRAVGAVVAMVPLALVFYRFDFPLKLRTALWVCLAAFVLLFGAFDPVAIGVTIGLYFAFTVVIWGTVYYHLRIGTKWTNGIRFVRLVLENPDSTSGNFLEQAPKCLLLVLGATYLSGSMNVGSIARVELFTLGISASAVLLHQWFFTWVPAAPLARTRLCNTSGATSKRVIAIVIDGCRADRLAEANTPFIDRLRAEGTEFTDMETVYPARTVTCFSSMLTGAPPAIHGMRSNFAPRLGVQCESIFDVLRSNGKTGRLVGIAHLIDAFGDGDVRTVTAVMKNELVDRELCEIAKITLREDDPELLALQLISVDQTGHARGSYNDEYLRQIEDTDRVIEEFVGWCSEAGYLEDATVLITADHGQGIGIGGHGHMSRTEIHVPCVMWGAGVRAGEVVTERRSIMDIGATIAYFLGVAPPEESRGQVLSDPASNTGTEIAVIIPAHNEAEMLPSVLGRIPRNAAMRVIVVDDGSTDGTAHVAEARGATVVRHPKNRGLGAALRTGLEKARDLGCEAAVYIDADGEYDAAEIPSLLAPVLAGQADYVVGSRYLGKVTEQRLVRRIGNGLLTVGLSVLAGRRLTDGQSGFRAFSRRALECAEIVHDYNYAQVLTLDMLRKGMRYAEVPVDYQVRKIGKSFISARYLWKVPLGIGRQMLKQ